ncbi:MAG: 23S rRNA (uracil(1939)-C(5))-methyltransferase RlmD [Acidobacteria bacterium]|nr:23S rRNA (uracil(1939)-C(5))-methyltransferase RlmD [Acidobacteriota bacterium]
MARNRNRPRAGEQHEVTIRDLAYGGKGVARLGSEEAPGMTVFVGSTAPGDEVRITLDRVKRRHAEAHVSELITAGPDRIEPSCTHYSEGCGGCSWQHLGYDTQLSAKEKVVRESLERIGEFADVAVSPIVAADEPWFYRNKMEFSFHARDGLGLHAGGDWRRVIPITECRLESELAMRIIEYARNFAQREGLAGWDPATNQGFLREIMIRHGRATGQTMVGLITERGAFAGAPEFAAGVAALDDSIVSVVRGIRGAFEEGSPIDRIETLYGSASIVEEVAGLRFNIGLQTFFQTSTAQAERMLAIVREEVQGVGSGNIERILDVFCGVGFFTLGLADLASEAIGVEIVEPSIIAARENASTNGIDNTSTPAMLAARCPSCSSAMAPRMSRSSIRREAVPAARSCGASLALPRSDSCMSRATRRR